MGHGLEVAIRRPLTLHSGLWCSWSEAEQAVGQRAPYPVHNKDTENNRTEQRWPSSSKGWTVQAQVPRPKMQGIFCRDFCSYFYSSGILQVFMALEYSKSHKKLTLLSELVKIVKLCSEGVWPVGSIVPPNVSHLWDKGVLMSTKLNRTTKLIIEFMFQWFLWKQIFRAVNHNRAAAAARLERRWDARACSVLPAALIKFIDCLGNKKTTWLLRWLCTWTGWKMACSIERTSQKKKSQVSARESSNFWPASITQPKYTVYWSLMHWHRPIKKVNHTLYPISHTFVESYFVPKDDHAFC